jgi:hypothetical protein
MTHRYTPIANDIYASGFIRRRDVPLKKRVELGYTHATARPLGLSTDSL